MTRQQAIAVGSLAACFLDEAEEHGKYRRNAHRHRPTDDDVEAQHFYDLEQALKAIEQDVGQEL